MPPKKPAADSADMPSSSDGPVEEKKTDAASLRKLSAHPSTAVMMKEALQDLDSGKGVSSHAIQSYIKQNYPSVDLVRLKHFVRRALKKGLETGALVRPANSKLTTGATGKFRIAPKMKEAKPPTENEDLNVEESSKVAKDGAKKPKKAGTTKKKDSSNEENEEHNPPKKTRKEKEAATSEPTTSKAALAKKPKARKAAEKDDGEGADSPSDSAKVAKASKVPKEAKAAKVPKEAKEAKVPKEAKEAKVRKEAKPGKASESKAAKVSSDAPAAKAIGKRGRKTAE